MSLKLINNLQFADKLNSKEAVTEAGKDFLKNYRGFCYSNPVNCTVVNNFIHEAKNFGYDTGVMSILESVLSFVKENNISWKFNSACESIQNNNSSYSYIAKTAVSKVEKLLEMNEQEVIAYVKAGALKDVQYVTEFRNICKEVYANSQVNEMRTLTFSASAPISYIFTNEDNQSFFMSNGKTYMVSENKVEEGTCEDSTFNRVNNIISNMKKVDENLVYEYKTSFMSQPTTFTINEENITISRNGNDKKFETPMSFFEHCNTLSSIMTPQEKVSFMSVSNSMKELFENISNVCELDQVKTITTTSGDVIDIVEGTENILVNVIKSNRFAGQMCESYNYITNALKDVQEIAKVNVMGLYEERIQKDAERENPEDVKKIQDSVKEAKSAKVELTRTRIAALAEQYKNDPVKIALLNTAAKQLAVFESKIEK